jgi:hypothetical protein
MTAEYNLNQLNSHKNIAIKEMWEKKRKDQSRTQNITEFGFNNAYISGTLNLQQLRLSRYIKMVFTLVELGPLQKWVVKSIVSTSDNTLKNVSGNTLKTRSEHYSSKMSFQKDHEGSSWENREKLEWAWTKIWLIECINILSYLSLSWIWLVSYLE